jgi:glucosamine kinase
VAIFLGIDGGGSKTACLVGNETEVLGLGTSPGSNVVRVGEAQARESLHAAIRQACQSARVTTPEIIRACIGVAGAAREEVREVIVRVAREIIPGEIEVVGDMEVAMEAAFGDGPGVIVIAGTGSIAYGKNTARRTARAGGWGHTISDEGSGHWIGRAAVAIALREADQQTESCLFKLILKSWGVTTHEQLVMMANRSPAPDFAALLPVVLVAAEKKNQQAGSVLVQAADELSTLAKQVIRALFSEQEAVPVAMAGGVFANSAQVRENFYNRLSVKCPNVRLAQTVIEPVQGALQLARKHAR